MPSNRTYRELLDANRFLRKGSDSFYFQCTTRTVQESKLFPVNPYISLSYLNAWYRWPELLRKIDAAMPAEEIGDRARQVGSYVNTITMSLIPNFYLGGRQILLDMGLLRPTDAVDDILDVLDFGQRVNSALHRGHEHMLPATPGCARRSTPSARPRSSRATPSASPPATGCTPPSGTSWPPARPTASSATASAG